MIDLDEDALKATVNLVGRTGAREFQIGYLHDDVPTEEAGWYAHAQYRGARIVEENHRGPIEAADALARRLLTGARCTGCQRLVALSDAGATAYPAGTPMADGSTWDGQHAGRTIGMCRWRRLGDRWEMGCRKRDKGRPKRKVKRKR